MTASTARRSKSKQKQKRKRNLTGDQHGDDNHRQEELEGEEGEKYQKANPKKQTNGKEEEEEVEVKVKVSNPSLSLTNPLSSSPSFSSSYHPIRPAPQQQQRRRCCYLSLRMQPGVNDAGELASAIASSLRRTFGICGAALASSSSSSFSTWQVHRLLRARPGVGAGVFERAILRVDSRSVAHVRAAATLAATPPRFLRIDVVRMSPTTTTWKNDDDEQNEFNDNTDGNGNHADD